MVDFDPYHLLPKEAQIGCNVFLFIVLLIVLGFVAYDIALS